jgi:hypothetical protein
VAIDEEQAAVVRFVFEEYAKGTGKKEIVKMLNAQGLKHKGAPFHVRLFEKWLVNVKYTGEFERFDRVWDNIYPQIVDKLTFERVQERLKENQILSGANSAVEPYILTGKAHCMKCGTAMVSDGGTCRDGSRVYYYACKKKKKGLCSKKRNYKDKLEKGVTVFVTDCLSDPEIANKAVDDSMRFHEQRTGDDGLRSIETRIANANAEVEQLTNSFIMAKNDLLRATIEKKMGGLEVYLKDLNAQKARIKLERGLKITKAQILEFIAELVKGDPDDKEFQKKIIDKLVYKVYIDDGSFFVLVNFFDMNKTEHVTFDETQEIIGNKAVQTSSPILHQSQIIRTT